MFYLATAMLLGLSLRFTRHSALQGAFGREEASGHIERANIFLAEVKAALEKGLDNEDG